MKIWGLFGLVLVLAACSGVTKEDLGLSRRSPDETQVEQRAPLSLPPEFGVRPIVGAD